MRQLHDHLASFGLKILEHLERVLVAFVFFLSRMGRGRPGYGRPTGILYVFAFAERMLERGHEIRALQACGVLRYEIARLPRGTRPLPLCPPVQPGDRIICLHWDNNVLAHIVGSEESSHRIAREVTRRTASDLTTLAGMVEAGVFPSDIRAVWPETVVYRALARLGFGIREAKPGIRRPFARLYILALMAIYGPPGLIDRSPDRLRHYQLGESWMDLRHLVQQYAPESQ